MSWVGGSVVRSPLAHRSARVKRYEGRCVGDKWGAILTVILSELGVVFQLPERLQMPCPLGCGCLPTQDIKVAVICSDLEISIGRSVPLVEPLPRPCIPAGPAESEPAFRPPFDPSSNPLPASSPSFCRIGVTLATPFTKPNRARPVAPS